MTVQNGGDVIFQNNVTLGNGDTGSDFGTGTVTIGRGSGTTTLSGYDGLTFGGPVVLTNGPVSIISNSSPIEFDGTVDGAQNLTVNSGTSTTTFDEAVGGTTPIGTGSGVSLALASSGLTTFNSTLATASGMSAAGPVVFNDDVTLGDGNTGSTFSGAVTMGKVGGMTISGYDGITFGGAITLANGQTTVNSNSSALTFNATIQGGQSLVANAGSASLQFNAEVGGSGSPLASLVAEGNTIVANKVTTTGTQSYTAAGGLTLENNLTSGNSDITITGPTTLGGDVTISTGPGAGDITFSGVTSTINGAHNLVLSAGTGDVTLDGVVGGITPLTSITISGNNLRLPLISAATQTYSALNDLTLSQSRTSSGPMTFTADSDNNGSGSFILLNGVALSSTNQPISITAADLDLQGNSSISSGSGFITITATNDRNIYLGGTDAPGQLTITGSELSRMSTSGGLDLKTTGIGWIKASGIASTDSQNITGVLGFKAQGSGDVSFTVSPSTFNAVTAQSGSGTINIDTDLTTTNDPITFATKVAVTGTATVNSGGGAIAFQNTLAVDNPLTLTTGGRPTLIQGQRERSLDPCHQPRQRLCKRSRSTAGHPDRPDLEQHRSGDSPGHHHQRPAGLQRPRVRQWQPHRQFPDLQQPGADNPEQPGAEFRYRYRGLQ